MHKYPGSEVTILPLKRIAQAERDTCQGVVARWQEQSLYCNPLITSCQI